MAFPYGNHSNRLFQNLHFEAFCIEHNIKYLNPTFCNISKYYVSPCRSYRGLKGRFTVFTMKIFKKTKLLHKIKNVKLFNIDNQDNRGELCNLSKIYNNIYTGGWYFRAHDLVEKHHDFFMQKYSLKYKYIPKAGLLDDINQWKLMNIIIVGIHIRRGDYISHEDGKYYDGVIYKKYMKLMQDEIYRVYERKCHFIIFSNEKTLIGENQFISKSNNEWYIDHYLMSNCDYLIGPPSTFTSWASYMGKVKMFHIETANDKLSLDKFKYCGG